jgi:hypothetical protein
MGPTVSSETSSVNSLRTSGKNPQTRKDQCVFKTHPALSRPVLTITFILWQSLAASSLCVSRIPTKICMHFSSRSSGFQRALIFGEGRIGKFLSVQFSSSPLRLKCCLGRQIYVVISSKTEKYTSTARSMQAYMVIIFFFMAVRWVRREIWRFDRCAVCFAIVLRRSCVGRQPVSVIVLITFTSPS